MPMARPGRFIEIERSFWSLVAAGVAVVEAGKVVGVSRATAQRWFSERGGVNPFPGASCGGGTPRRYARLSHAERHQIVALRRCGHGPTQIAAILDREVSTITRELKRNANEAGQYRADAAQHRAETRARERARAASPPKLATHERLREEVQTRLKERHSPEQIARRLREDFPNDPEMWVSHETIYQSLYVQGRGALRRELTQQLRTGRTLRKPRQRTGQRKERFAGMVMISDRPAEVEDRAVPGHWEGDLILGSQASGSAVGTLVERTTRFVMLLHLPGGHTADIVQEAMVAKMATLPEQLRRSLTWDQGSEMANHLQIADATGLDIYFCDPHSPWQRGTNENTNGLLRQYLAKGSDLSFYGPGLLDQIAQELNDRPRKTLNWRTPAEALTALLSGSSEPPPVALTP
jgi:transposase, IS30 family